MLNLNLSVHHPRIARPQFESPSHRSLFLLKVTDVEKRHGSDSQNKIVTHFFFNKMEYRDYLTLYGFIPLEEEMATHSSILAWKIPWMEEPGRLQSTGSQRVRHD